MEVVAMRKLSEDNTATSRREIEAASKRMFLDFISPNVKLGKAYS
tara:strand:+ start:827 stop:961 length:135 start_codon:yes stop_codon:yes gene_type:complete